MKNNSDQTVSKDVRAAAEIFPPSPENLQGISVTLDSYNQMYAESISAPDSFWLKMANILDWIKKPTHSQRGDFNNTLSKQSDPLNEIRITWFEDGLLNAAANCLDRHLPERENQVAIIFEADDPEENFPPASAAAESSPPLAGEMKGGRRLTYGELHREVCKLANGLKSLGIQKGDRVIIYMPMVPEAAISMLACARIGAVHSVVFGGFSPESLKSRIEDCGAKLIITADEGLRGGKKVPLKANVDVALCGSTSVEKVIVFKRTGSAIKWQPTCDIWWHELLANQSEDCPPEPMNAEDPLFILYTSGSTGKPKGVLHTTGGYMVYAALTHKTTFDYKDGEVFWCTADVGWVTGHSYIVYGPLANGATTLMFEGVPNYPDFSRFWQVIDKHKVNIFYTAPTAIRALLREGDDWVKRTSRASLRLLGSVGEPINHEAWLWYHRVVGDGRCPIMDTWWQTETGGHMITPLPCMDLKPGSAALPFFGVKPEIVNAEGKVLEGTAEGNLVLAGSWPGQMRTLYGDHARFVQTYFSIFPGKYFTGDGAKRDENGYYWITGRVDDVINVSGHRLGTAEIESAINEHPAVAESAVTGYPHDIKGQGIYAYVILLPGFAFTEDLKKEIIQTVRRIIGPIATPDVIQNAPGLPKTRSGKIMRRILRKIAAGELDSLGDTSTLADPGVVEALVKGKH